MKCSRQNIFMDIFRRISSKLTVISRSSYFATTFISNKCNENHRANKKKRNFGFKNTKCQFLIGSVLIGLSLPIIKEISQKKPGVFQEGLPEYTREEVAKHRTKKTRVWVIYKEGVYDVTDYLKEHPGGEDTLMQAAGTSIEPFWAIYIGHEGNEEVNEELEKLRIGNLKLKPGEPPCETKEFKKKRCDYFNDPERSEILKPICTQPFAGGPLSSLLTESFLTPSKNCFIHNHLPVPNVDLSSYNLIVEIDGVGTTKFSLNELKKMPQTIVTATLQCPSNRSLEMAKEFKSYVQGPAWQHNAICNVEWRGVLLLDVLKAAGYETGCECNPHIQFESLECIEGTYSTSIPLWRTTDEKNEVLLAYEMNGQPLSRDHGFPLRVVIPGVAGTRWVKSLEKIRMQSKECDSSWHKFHNKFIDSNIKGPDLKESQVEFAPAINEMPINSAICKPMDRQNLKVKGGRIQVEGYAWSGGGQKVARVDISIDNGKTWLPTKITYDEPNEPPFHWTWALWTAVLPIEKGTKCVDIWAKATDTACNSQPENWQWNFGGVACNAIHKVRVFIK